MNLAHAEAEKNSNNVTENSHYYEVKAQLHKSVKKVKKKRFNLFCSAFLVTHPLSMFAYRMVLFIHLNK